MTVVPIDKSAEYIGQVHDLRYRRKPLWKVVRSDKDYDHMRMDVLKFDMSHCQQKPSNSERSAASLTRHCAFTWVIRPRPSAGHTAACDTSCAEPSILPPPQVGVAIASSGT